MHVAEAGTGIPGRSSDGVGRGMEAKCPVSVKTVCRHSQQGVESPLMLSPFVRLDPLIEPRHKDSPRAISTSPMAGACAWSVIDPPSLLGRRRQRTRLGDDAVRRGDAHRGSVKRAAVGALNWQAAAQ